MNRDDLDEEQGRSPVARSIPLRHSQPAFDTSPQLSPPLPQLQLQYRVAMPKPETHLFEVTLTIQGWPMERSQLDLKMPVWTPGSYLVREYARHLQNFAAIVPTAKGAVPLAWTKQGKNHWQIATQGNTTLEIRYRVFANDLTVRTNHLDSSHGYFNGAALFLYLPGLQHQPLRVTIVPPRADWRVITALPPVADQPLTYLASNFDTLVDSPFEIGQHQLYCFEAAGKTHELAVWGQGNLKAERLIADMQRIIEVEAELFGGLPYDRYVFLLHLAAQGFGGLEHKYSCSLIYSRFGFRQKDKYDRFLQLVAHEFFHLWNVKRIRPQGLEVFDYDQENYTPSLWFSEGTTSYYDLLLPLRAGLYDVRTYLSSLSREITRYLNTPGRRVQPLSESSFDAWIKLYRPDANSSNTQISYYLKGEMVSLLLDLLIRYRHQNQRSLDDVMRQMWKQFGQPEVGFTPAQLKAVLESIADLDLTNFFHRYVDGLDELPFDEYLAPFGLRLHPQASQESYLGMTVKTEQGREQIKLVEAGSPAQLAGITAGDELLALDGLRITADQLSDRLQDYQPGDSLQLSGFHQDELCHWTVTLAPPRPDYWEVTTIPEANARQASNFAGWLGKSLPEVFR